MRHFYLKIFILIFVILFYNNTLASQEKWDAQWIMGYDNSIDQLGGGTLIDFNLTPPEVFFIEKKPKFEGANTSMSDSLGNLLFYSNGCKIINKNHETMENGDTLSPGNFFQFVLNWCDDDDGSPLAQSILALPIAQDENQYYTVSYNSDAISIDDTIGTVVGFDLFLNKIDMSLNNGLGKVIEKNLNILSDTLTRGFLQAVKHANGQDWWVIAPEFRSNCHYIIHLTKLGVLNIKKQCIGHEWNWIEGSGQAVFSPDGTKYARFQPSNNLNIFDFDRCAGELSNPIIISFPNDTIDRAGVSFSPNSRFLYAHAFTKLYQFDMQATDVPGSQILIDEYDGFADPFPTRFYMGQLAMDGKIYISSAGTHEHLHVIHNPDSLGTLCNFEQHAIKLASLNYWSMPNFAHYRLGASSTPCYPLTTTYNIENVKCYGESTGRIEVYTSSGTSPYHYSWDDTSLVGNEISNLSAGIYNVTITDALDSITILSMEISQPLEEISASISTNPEIGNAQNGMAEVIVTGGTSPYQYVWKKDSIILQTDSIITNLDAGLYELIITDANGCSIEEIVEIEQTTSTSFLLEELTFFDIFPNPSNGNVLLKIHAKKLTLFSIELHNSLGQKIQTLYQSEILEKQLSIPVNNLPEGVFFVVVKIGEKVQTQKLVVLD